MEKDLKKANKELKDSAKAWSKLTAPIAAFGVAAVASFQKVEGALNKIRISTGATGKALQGLQNDFRKVAANSASSLDSVATVLGDINTKLGLTGKPLQELTTQITNLSRLTGEDGSALTGGIAKAFNIAKVAAEDFGTTLDSLFITSQNTGVSVGSLTTTISQFAPILQKFGMDVNTSAAFLGTLEKSGFSASTVMAALQMGMTKLAKGGITNNVEGLKSLISRIRDTTSETERVSIATKVFGTNAETMIQVIRSGAFDMDNLSKVLLSNGNTINQVANDTETLSDKWTKLTNSFSVNGSAIGKSLSNLASGVLDQFNKQVSTMSDETADSVVRMGLMLTAIGPLQMALSGLISVLTSAVGALKAVAAAMAAGKTGVEVFSAALGGLPALLTVVATTIFGTYIASLQAAQAETAKLKKATDEAIASYRVMTKEQRIAERAKLKEAQAKTAAKLENINNRPIDLSGLDEEEREKALRYAGLARGTATDIVNRQEVTPQTELSAGYDLIDFRDEVESKLSKFSGKNALTQLEEYVKSLTVEQRKQVQDLINSARARITPILSSNTDYSEILKKLGKGGSGGKGGSINAAEKAAKEAEKLQKQEVEGERKALNDLKEVYAEEDWMYQHHFTSLEDYKKQMQTKLDEIQSLREGKFKGEENRKVVEDMWKQSVSQFQNMGETEAGKLADQFEAGYISASELQQKAKELTDQFAAMNIPVGNTLKSMSDGTYTAKKAMDELKQSSIQALGQLKSGLIDAIVEGGNLADTLKNVGTMLIKIALNSMLSKPFGNLTSWLGKAFGAHTGGIVGVDAPSFVRSLPKFHTGGIVGANEQLSVLQKGEAVFTKEQQKALGGLIHKDSSVKDVTINITNNGSGNMSNEQAQQLAKQIKAYVKTEVADEMYTYNRNKMYAMG